jgi:hypothetical protein
LQKKDYQKYEWLGKNTLLERNINEKKGTIKHAQLSEPGNPKRNMVEGTNTTQINQKQSQQNDRNQ